MTGREEQGKCMLISEIVGLTGDRRDGGARSK